MLSIFLHSFILNNLTTRSHLKQITKIYIQIYKYLQLQKYIVTEMQLALVLIKSLLGT